MINKKGNLLGIMLVLGGLFFIVMVGIMAVIGSSTINYVMDIAVPELSALGVVGDVNVSHTIDVTIDPVNTFIQNFTWVSGIIYVFGLLGIFGLAFSYKATGDKWLIGLFFAVTFILIIGCIFMSNIYEDVYNGNDQFSNIIKEHVAISWLILYSPGIMSLLAFIAGIILFSGPAGDGI